MTWVAFLSVLVGFARISKSNCIAPKCHQGIEPIYLPGSEKMKIIEALGREMNDPAGCVVCHGGDPRAKSKDRAHRKVKGTVENPPVSTGFYPDPGSPWVNRYTCGRCHQTHVFAQTRSPMMTGAGMVQMLARVFGLSTDSDQWLAYYRSHNPGQRYLGSKTYRAYMSALETLEPSTYPMLLAQLPQAPQKWDEIAAAPGKIALTVLRSHCSRCHLGVKGRTLGGTQRGMGCSACHIPYAMDGKYRGGDKSIPRSETGHMLVHSIQSTQRIRVKIGSDGFRGIPIQTCAACHNYSKKTALSYRGLVNQTSLATLGGDVHYNEGMLCQDCHTSTDVHGDGNLSGTTLSQVEVECTDCHGTPNSYPWELPLGYADSLAEIPQNETSRGTLQHLDQLVEPYLFMRQRTTFPPEDGYLVTARGNPFFNVVRKGDKVVVHSARGEALLLTPLKLQKASGKLQGDARVAMVLAKSHLEKMECYACHASWAPQEYGRSISVDYTEGKKSFDWVAAGVAHGQQGYPHSESTFQTYVAGTWSEQVGLTTLAAPPLAINGEGRISPVIPILPVKLVAGDSGYGSSPPASKDVSAGSFNPLQPHTIGTARSCSSCHMSNWALGKGAAGDLVRSKERFSDEHARILGYLNPALEPDWTRLVDQDGTGLQVGGGLHRRSRPLSKQEQELIERKGVCIACHSEIPDQSLAVGYLNWIGDLAGINFDSAQKHSSLIHRVLMTHAWTYTLAAPLLLALGLALLLLRRRRKTRAKRDSA
ncbi:MAG: cytochrome C [Deltaproteobacteria bacterium]|nr:cytochrome C [Deltaproteobacteria bacterium]